MSHAAAMHGHGPAGNVTKRDFLKLVTGAGAAIGGAAFAWTLVDSMNPSKDVLALSAVEADLAPIAEGSGITIVWQGKPIFIRHRTPAEIKSAEDVQLSQLIDPQADSARVKPSHAQWIVLIGICTHLGCPAALYEQTTQRILCPCHQSTFQANTGATVIFGPAPRPLPQLPIATNAQGYLVAQSDFQEPVGPSFWERG